MKRLVLILTMVLIIGTGLLPVPVTGQGIDTGVTGAGAGIFPDGATFNGVHLTGLQLGQGVFIASDGTATGEFHVVLLGTSLLGKRQDIVVEGKVNSGSALSEGSVSFSGLATVNVGDGVMAPVDLPFTVTIGRESLILAIGGSTLPAVRLVTGSITIR